MRFIGANQPPDHASLGALRTANEPALVAAFTPVLPLAHPLRLTQLGSVSVDGAKLAANATKQARRRQLPAGRGLAGGRVT